MGFGPHCLGYPQSSYRHHNNTVVTRDLGGGKGLFPRVIIGGGDDLYGRRVGGLTGSTGGTVAHTHMKVFIGG